MAVFTGYYDASGSDIDRTQDAHLVVAGLIATTEQWARLEDDWRSMLKRHGLPYLHAADFISGRGDFAAWRGRSEHVDSVLLDFVGITKRRVENGFHSAIRVDDLKEIRKRYDLSQLLDPPHPRAGPFSFSASNCRGKVINWMARNHNTERIVHVFESGDYGKGALLLMTENEPGSGRATEFAPKVDSASGEHYPFFQAVDLVAWEWRNLYEVVVKRREVPVRGSLAALRNWRSQSGGIHTITTLTAMCEAYPKYFRKLDAEPQPSASDGTSPPPPQAPPSAPPRFD